MAPIPLPPVPPRRLPAGEDPRLLRLAMARPDASGRLSVRQLMRVLQWSADDRIDQVVVGDAVVITRSATGRSTVGIRGDLTIPSRLRALAAIDDGQVLLVAVPSQDTLVAHAELVVANLLTEHYARLDINDDG